MYFVLCCAIPIISVCIPSVASVNVAKPEVKRLSRAYNNPYHPEDDGIIEDISDVDGDNLRYEGKKDQLSDSEKDKTVQKHQKINGRYYEVVRSDKGLNYSD